VLAESGQNVPSTSPIPSKPNKDEKDELFIDDESDITDQLGSDDMMMGEEGSGMGSPSKGTGAEDMESSGSGYGPDDEDAHVRKTKVKTPIDSEEDEDDEEDDEIENDNEDFVKENPSKINPSKTSTTSTTTSTTTTTTENYGEESRILELVCYFISFFLNIFLLLITNDHTLLFHLYELKYLLWNQLLFILFKLIFFSV
jgi:hypothetical protein